MTKLEITIENLKIVREKLPLFMAANPERVKYFDMGNYGGFCLATKEQYNENVCNTSGCLLGNIALLKSDFPATGWMFRATYFSYGAFGRFYFPYLYDDDTDIITQDWNFLFGPENINDFDDAMRRLDVLIADLSIC